MVKFQRWSIDKGLFCPPSPQNLEISAGFPRWLNVVYGINHDWIQRPLDRCQTVAWTHSPGARVHFWSPVGPFVMNLELKTYPGPLGSRNSEMAAKVIPYRIKQSVPYTLQLQDMCQFTGLLRLIIYKWRLKKPLKPSRTSAPNSKKFHAYQRPIFVSVVQCQETRDGAPGTLSAALWRTGNL